jgi:hypothetical protein
MLRNICKEMLFRNIFRTFLYGPSASGRKVVGKEEGPVVESAADNRQTAAKGGLDKKYGRT